MPEKTILFALVFGFAFLTARLVFAEVPNRITYQGRLSKSGVGVAGKHIFVANIVNQAGTLLWSSGNREINVPATGDFSLVLEPDLDGDDWLTNTVKLEISGDGGGPTRELPATHQAHNERCPLNHCFSSGRDNKRF